MTGVKYLPAVVLIIISFSSCREKYTPDIASATKSYLVVEGILNPNGPASVHITHTAKLDTGTFRPELNAQVTVEGKDNSIRSLAQGGNGYYTSPNLNLIVNNEYRLRIRTSAGREYLSDYVKAVITPPVDSIGWKIEGDNFRLYVNAHDATGNTRYYRWDYDETWEIVSYYHSYFIYQSNTNTVRPRTIAEDVSDGWKYHSSTNIILASSARLQSDVIFQAPVNSIQKGDDRLSVRYSILLRQYALDEKGYDFYQLIKATTESLGTVFDPQPSTIKGNIRSLSDPSELVIGYISASTIAEKRIFVLASAVPGDWHYFQDCPAPLIKNNPDSIRDAYATIYLMPFDASYSPSGQLIGYFSSYASCVDVTVRGASTTRPPYW